MSRALTLGLLIAALAALALRCPQLAVRPMHNDEAVNAIRLRALWERGEYKYNPQEYHGPTLIYGALAWVKLVGAKDFVDCTESQLRGLTVAFGLGLILLLPLVADGLGQRATICAGLLTAVSPAMVFYSRYFIHEMLLVFFAFLALASGWRYTRSGKILWAIIAGAAVGLMQATKETFILSVGVAAIALVINSIFNRGEPKTAAFQYRFKHIAAAILAWLVVVVVLFTSFFKNAQGPMDAVRTYLPWLHRVEGASAHIHPWNFYLERVAFFHHGKLIWSEGFILLLALIGIVAAFLRRGIAEGNAAFVRFVALYTILLTAVYSVISYKTPWCLLNFWHGAILLAGVGSVALVEWSRKRPITMAVTGLVAAVGVMQLASQAWSAGVEYAASPANPYVYAQTSPDILNLVEKVDAIGKLSAEKNQMVIKVMAPRSDYWPLPWYLRRFEHVGFYSAIPADPDAPVIIVSAKFQTDLDADKKHLMAGLFEMRPQVFFELYVETNLWNEYVKLPKADKEN